MTVFFLVLLVVSFVALAAETILRSAYKIRDFGIEKRFFDFEASTVPVQDFLPHNFTDILVYILAFSFCGLILSALTMPAIGSVFCSFCFGCIALYTKKHLLKKIWLEIKKERLPKDRPDAGDSAVCKNEILGDGYGSISFEYMGREYVIPAISANETDIEEGEMVTVVHKEQGICWVEKESEELREVEE